jgi:hypothetical protein
MRRRSDQTIARVVPVVRRRETVSQIWRGYLLTLTGNIDIQITYDAKNIIQ